MRFDEVARKVRAALPKTLGTPHFDRDSTSTLVGTIGVEGHDVGAAWHEIGN